MLKQYLKIRVTGLNLSRLLNSLTCQGIQISSLAVEKGGSISFCIRVGDRKKLFANIDERCYNVSILQERSPAALGKLMLVRLGLIAGAVLFIAAVIVYSQFVWRISIDGAQVTGVSNVRQILTGQGLKEGVRKSDIDVDRLISALEESPTISKASVRIKGTGVRILLVETLEHQTEIDLGVRRDIVSGADGIVTDILVLSGRAAVKKGQAVRAGQVLIEGIIDNQAGEMLRETRASGRVTVSGHVKAEGVFFTHGSSLVRTGRQKSSQQIMLFGKPFIRAAKAKKLFDLYESETTMQPLFYGQLLPLVKAATVYYECELKITEYDYEERKAELENKLTLEAMSGGNKISIVEKHSYITESGGGYLMKLYFTTENIFE